MLPYSGSITRNFFVEMKQGAVDNDAVKMPAPVVQEEEIKVNAVKRRRRTIITSYQNDVLTAAFLKDPYPHVETKEWLATQLGLAQSVVRIWFQNRRAKVQRKAEDGKMVRRFQQESVNRDMNRGNIFAPFPLPLVPQPPPIFNPHFNPLFIPGAMPGVQGAPQGLMTPAPGILPFPPPMLHPKHFGLPPLPFPLPTPSIDMKILHSGDGCASEPPKPQ